MSPVRAGRDLAQLRVADPTLGKWIERLGPLGESPFFEADKRTPFAMLAQSVTHQQLGGAAAKAIFGRLKATLGGRLSPARLLEATPEALRAAGLSGSKVRSLKDLAQHTLDGTVPGRAGILRLSDDEILQRLTSIRGIGPWTVEMLLLKLGRPDILPATDLEFAAGLGWCLGMATWRIPVRS